MILVIKTLPKLGFSAVDTEFKFNEEDDYIIGKRGNSYYIFTAKYETCHPIYISDTKPHMHGDYYIVQLNTSTDNYIGIKLIKDVQKFNIFYIQ